MKIDGQLRKDLALLSLSDYELRVFAAACELGSGSAALLAKRAKIPRPSVYPVLNSLVDKGLVSIEERKGANTFIPASPETLVVLAEEELEEAKESLAASKRVAEVLRSSRGRDALTSAKILIFEGKRAITQYLHEIDGELRRSLLERNKPWMGFQDAAFLRHYGDWVVEYWRKFKRAKDWQRDKLKLFSAEDPSTKRVAKETEPFAGERRQLKPLPTQFPFSSTLWIVGEYVVLLKTREEPHYALHIRDEVLADNLGAVFDFVWELSP